VRRGLGDPRTPSRQRAAADRLADLLDRQEVIGERLAIADLGRPVAALGVEEVEQAQRAAAIGILADLAAADVVLSTSPQLRETRSLQRAGASPLVPGS